MASLKMLFVKLWNLMAKFFHSRWRHIQTFIGMRSILMELSNPIPPWLLIDGHWWNAVYVGQIPTCFSCHKSGHSFKDCPDRQKDEGNLVIHRCDPSKAINTLTVQSTVQPTAGNNNPRLTMVGWILHLH